MYTLQFTDGSIISNLERVGVNDFQLESNESMKIYQQLSDANLSFVLVFQDDEMVDTLIDFTKQNFSCYNGIVQFRLISIKDLRAAEKHRREKEQIKHRKRMLELRIEKEMEANGM